MDEKDWDNVAASFEAEIFNVPANDRKGLIKQRIQRLGGKKRTAADIGCGIGRTLPLLAKAFGDVFAVDVSRKCLDIAEHANRKHTNIQYRYADLTKKNGLERPVDLVLCINTLLNASLAKREGILANTCAAVARGGHLLMVVPSVESALLTSHMLVQWNRRDGLSPLMAERKARRAITAIEHGIVSIDNVPTKHHLKEELEQLLSAKGFRVEEVLKVEYPWTTEFEVPPRWMKAPFPWDWLVLAQRIR